MIKLNLGCGSNKIKGCINIDCEKTVRPDIVLDFTTMMLPYDDKTVGEVYLFHTIEHIQKVKHKFVLGEIARVLKLDGKVYISYPNFWECAQRWNENRDGQRQFWENTIFGRQLFPSDFHVCAMNPVELMRLMLQLGFKDVSSKPEAKEPYNTITIGSKGIHKYELYYDQLKADVRRMVVKK